MADTAYTLTDDWDSDNRYTAAADVDVLVSIPGMERPDAIGRIAIIAGADTTPSITAAQGHPIKAGGSRAIALKSGDRLWLACSITGIVATLGVLTP